MKKIFSLLLVLVLACALISCDDSSEEDDDTTPEPTPTPLYGTLWELSDKGSTAAGNLGEIWVFTEGASSNNVYNPTNRSYYSQASSINTALTEIFLWNSVTYNMSHDETAGTLKIESKTSPSTVYYSFVESTTVTAADLNSYTQTRLSEADLLLRASQL